MKGDAKEFQGWLTRVVGAGVEAGLQSLRDEAAALAANIRRNAPRKTGKLAASVRVEEHLERGVVLIRAGGPTTTVPVRKGLSQSYDYALAQELGTKHQHAIPFFYPTWRRGRSQAIPRIKKEIRKAIESAT